MKFIPLILLLVVLPQPALAAAPENDLAREVALTREMIEDVAIRFDDEGLRLGRERAARLAAEAEAAGDARLAREAHYLIALAVWAQLYTGHNDVAALARLAEEGIRHADRAAALDESFADAFALGGADRAGLFLLGARSPEIRTAMIERIQRSVKLDPASPPVAFFSALAQSINPAGPAAPAGIQAYADLVERLETRLAGGAARPGFWDVQARGWFAIVRLQSESPEIGAIRPDVARLVAMRPDSALARELAARVEHRSWAPAASLDGLAWRALGSDAAGDGTNAAWPDLRSLELARGAARVWFRLTFEKDLPPSFGVNLAIDRDGDPGAGARWWGGGSSFRYDRLVTAWVVREGDGYFGITGVTDANGGATQRLMKRSTDVLLRLGEDGRSVTVGVPMAALELAAGARILGAGGTNLMWNDNLAAEGGEGIEIPAQ
jgi:hypothetical protein